MKAQRRGSTLSLTSVLDEGGWSTRRIALPPGKEPGTYCAGGWVGTRICLGGCGKTRHWDPIPGPSRP